MGQSQALLSCGFRIINCDSFPKQGWAKDIPRFIKVQIKPVLSSQLINRIILLSLDSQDAFHFAFACYLAMADSL